MEDKRSLQELLAKCKEMTHHEEVLKRQIFDKETEIIQLNELFEKG